MTSNGWFHKIDKSMSAAFLLDEEYGFQGIEAKKSLMLV